jgi:hypothetical protein
MLKPIITAVNLKENIHPFDLSQTQIDLLMLFFNIDR